MHYVLSSNAFSAPSRIDRHASWNEITMKITTLILLLVFSSCVECFAGTSGVLSGYVHTWSGQPVAHVIIIAKSPSQSCMTHTDKHGFFVCLTLPPDRYSVWAQKTGTKNAYGFVRIDSDQTTFLDIRFHPLRQCSGIVNVRLTAEPFTSLDVKLMENYPPNVAPLISLPMSPVRQHYWCL